LLEALSRLLACLGRTRQRKGIKRREDPAVAVSGRVGVPVEGCGCLLMSHDLRYVVDRHTVGDEPGRIRVPQVMKPETHRQPGPLE